jgi:ABC-type glycerol-3-phosphate transport system substrate-binding protein
MLTIQILKSTKMKNSIKLGILSLIIAICAAACSGTSKTGSADTTVKVDSTVKKDSTVKVDSSATDTAKKDTTGKK